MGELGILNVGAGDDKLVFDPNDPKSMERGARVVADMLQRGYALLIEVPDGKGGTKTKRVTRFMPDRHEYLIDEVPEEATAPRIDRRKGPRKARIVERSVPAAGTRGIAVARIAGG